MAAEPAGPPPPDDHAAVADALGGVRHYIPRDFDITRPGGAVYMRRYRTNQDVLDLFINDPLVAPPGTRVSYSSYGFTLYLW